MTDRELKKLSRAELLELLLAQGQTVDELNERIAQLEEQLEQRELRMENAGSIAEAALQLTGVFEAAQRSADIYLSSIQRMEAESKQRREQADQLYAQVQAKCRELLETTRASCRELRRRAESGSDI